LFEKYGWIDTWGSRFEPHFPQEGFVAGLGSEGIEEGIHEIGENHVFMFFGGRYIASQILCLFRQGRRRSTQRITDKPDTFQKSPREKVKAAKVIPAILFFASLDKWETWWKPWDTPDNTRN
jgi:hypothetical protein